MIGRNAVLAASLLALAACSTSGPSRAEADAAPMDASVDAPSATISPHAPDGEQPTWDPVWHETNPADWPTIGPDGMPDCGPGCRVALNGRIDARHWPPSISLSGIVDALGHLHWVPIGATHTRLLYVDNDAEESATLFASIYGKRVSYLMARQRSLAVEVVDISTGERKRAYEISVRANDMGISFTALNSKYVFWSRPAVGLMARNMDTGEIRIIKYGSPGSRGACATEHGLWVFAPGEIKFFDQETGKVSYTDADGEWALQVDATCAASRKQITWVDYRDPPGPGSNYDFTRRGGEVYVKDLVSGKVERVTFDSPSNPRAKAHPVVDGTRFVWLEQSPELDPNPETAQELYAGAGALVRYDTATGERCRMPFGALQYVRPYALLGNRLYGAWPDEQINEPRLVEVDLDHPSFEWECGYIKAK